jgi:hypothetical protein
VYAGKRRAIDELPLTREDAQKARDVAGRAELNKYLADNGLGDALTGSASEVAGKLAADKDFSALIAGMNGNDANKKRLATGVLTGTTGKLALEKYITGLETEQGKLDANDAEKRAEIQKKIDAAKAALGATSDASTTPFIFKFSGDSTQLKGVLEQGGKK